MIGIGFIFIFSLEHFPPNFPLLPNCTYNASLPGNCKILNIHNFSVSISTLQVGASRSTGTEEKKKKKEHNMVWEVKLYSYLKNFQLWKYLRNERRLLFFNFLLLFIPALEGDSSLAFGWLATFEEFCWLKCVGTWRASPPWDAKLALHPPTTHWIGTKWQQDISGAVGLPSWWHSINKADLFEGPSPT